MPRACVLVLQRPPYYGDLMMQVLEGMGYTVTDRPFGAVKPGDVMVTWNRHRQRDAPIREHEAQGGTVVVVENGYFGRNFRGSEWYALALDQHNGAGRWPAGDKARWASFGVSIEPWRTGGHDIVVLASRGMGSEGCREPAGWSDRVAEALRAKGWPVRIRRHPGPQARCDEASLEDDLADAWAAVTWGSTAGLKALTLGVPVFHGFPDWIGAGAARRYADDLPERYLGERAPMFERVATAMWSREEIESGKAFRCLLT